MGSEVKKYRISSKFIWRLTILIQLLRFIGTAIVILFPDFRNIHNFLGMIYANDGQWYYQIAVGGLVQYSPEGILLDRFANFSLFFPFLIALVGQITTPIYAPFVINTLCTIPIPWLAAKLAVKIVPSSEEGTTEDQAWRQRLVVLGIALNPAFLGFSIFALTEPLFYFFMLVVFNCNQRKGGIYVVGELAALFFMGWTKFNTLLICAFYFYQLIVRDFGNRNFKQLLRSLACIALVLANFFFWNFIFPLSIWGMTASASMEKWWGVKITFDPSSIYFFPKLGIEFLAMLGVLAVFRTLCIRKNWGYLGFRDKYLAELRRTKRTPAADGLDPKIYPEFDQAGKIGPLNYELIEALLFYGFCVIGFHGLLDPLSSFFRYTTVILPFYACISFQNSATTYQPGAMLWAIGGAFCSVIGAFIYLLAYAAILQLPTWVLPPDVMTFTWWPELIICIALSAIAVILFLQYFYHLKYSAPKIPDLKKITMWLVACSLVLMFVVLYMP